ncbi:MAG TPA: gamma-glutamyltransferase [Vicinamibacteria bacterium]|nr:gamma-glutamyltransferase [Vicinamibacteria bacterium]
MRLRPLLLPALLGALALPAAAPAASVPVRTRLGMVASQNAIASQVGVEVLVAGGNAVDAAVATAFALAVVHPAAGNIGGGGFLLVRPAAAKAAVYDFREMAPATASPRMFLVNGAYSEPRHHDSHLAVGVPGTVAGLQMAWLDYGRLHWKDLLRPAIGLARDGFVVSDGLARSLREVLPRMKRYPASLAQFSREGAPYEAGDILKQPDLARTLERIADKGAKGFYAGETAELMVREMQAHGGLITLDDLRGYQIYRRPPLRGRYRGFEVLTVPPPSSGGVVLLECLNLLEGYDLAGMGVGSSSYVHHVTEALRRAFADRARYLGDPEQVSDMPVDRLVSKPYADQLRRTIREDRASVSAPAVFEWPAESDETTHLSVVDRERNAAALTYTLEDGYGSKIVVPGAGFLLNNEMGDFNAGPGLTDESGLIGTAPNLAAPHKRMLSSMTPTIISKDGRLALVEGSPGGRSIPSTVLETTLDLVDFGMNVQEAVDQPRFFHQWLPDEIHLERLGFPADTRQALLARGHRLSEIERQGVVEAIALDAKEDLLEGGSDRRAPDGAAVGH